MNKDYYTAEEVMKLLGISKSTLNRRAEEGQIPSELEKDEKEAENTQKRQSMFTSSYIKNKAR